MAWDLIEIDPDPGIVGVVFYIQFMILVFSFFYFLYVFVDVLATKRKLQKVKIALQKTSDKKTFKEEAIRQKEIYRSNEWLGPMMDYFACDGDKKNANAETMHQQEILSVRVEKYLKNSVFLRWLAYFSLATAFFTIFERTISRYGMTDLLWAMMIPAATILLIIAVIFLKRHLSEIYKQSIMDLQQSCPAPGIARPAG